MIHAGTIVVVAVNRSDRSAHVVSGAALLAAVFDKAVHVVHALTRSKFIGLGLTSAQAEEPKDMDEIRSTAAEMTEDSVPGLDVLYETVGLVGNPADEVVEYADGQGASYIMVSPRRRSRAGEMLFGSAVQSIPLNTSCPVVLTLAGEK